MVVKCAHLKVFCHVGAWRGRAFSTFVYHCDVIARAQRCTLQGRWRWLKGGENDLNADNSASKIIWFDRYDLNDCGKMETDLVFVSGAMGWTRHHALVGLPGSALRAEWRAAPLLRGGASDHSSWRNNVINSYSHTLSLVLVVTCGPAAVLSTFSHGAATDMVTGTGYSGVQLSFCLVLLSTDGTAGQWGGCVSVACPMYSLNLYARYLLCDFILLTFYWQLPWCYYVLFPILMI